MDEPLVKTDQLGSGTFNVKRTPTKVPPAKRQKISDGVYNRASEIESKSSGSTSDSDAVDDQPANQINQIFDLEPFMPPPPPLQPNRSSTLTPATDSLSLKEHSIFNNSLSTINSAHRSNVNSQQTLPPPSKNPSKRQKITVKGPSIDHDFTVGQIVWVCKKKFIWPCLILNSPEEVIFMKIFNEITHFHVYYYGTYEMEWVRKEHLLDYSNSVEKAIDHVGKLFLGINGVNKPVLSRNQGLSKGDKKVLSKLKSLGGKWKKGVEEADKQTTETIANRISDLCDNRDTKYHGKVSLQTLSPIKRAIRHSKAYSCDLCQQIHPTLRQLDYHVKIVHAIDQEKHENVSLQNLDLSKFDYNTTDDEDLLDDDIDIETKKRKPFCCQLCRKRFSTFNDLEFHQGYCLYNERFSALNLTCKFCDLDVPNIFDTADDLQRHTIEEHNIEQIVHKPINAKRYMDAYNTASEGEELEIYEKKQKNHKDDNLEKQESAISDETQNKTKSDTKTTEKPKPKRGKKSRKGEPESDPFCMHCLQNSETTLTQYKKLDLKKCIDCQFHYHPSCVIDNKTRNYSLDEFEEGAALIDDVDKLFDEDKNFHCYRCLHEKPAKCCGVCLEKIDENLIDTDAVVTCCDTDCGFNAENSYRARICPSINSNVYHRDCLELHPLVYKKVADKKKSDKNASISDAKSTVNKSVDNAENSDTNSDKNPTESELKLVPFSSESEPKNDIYKCPRHYCISCIGRTGYPTQNLDGQSKNSIEKSIAEKDLKIATFENDEYRLGSCILCTKTYHISDVCLPAGAVILDKAKKIICPDHRDKNITVFKPKFMSKNQKNLSIKSDANFCFTCGDSGHLVCCANCPATHHAECVSESLKIDSDEDVPFYCLACTAGQQFYPYEMLWIKYGGYRWWPAEILPYGKPTLKLKESQRMFGDFKVMFVGTEELAWMNRGRVYVYQEGDKDNEKLGSIKGSSLSQAFRYAMEIVEQKMTEINNFKKQEREEFEDVVMGNSNKKPAKYLTLKTNKPYSSKLKMVPADTGYRMEESTCDCRPNDLDPCGLHSECINQLTHMECGENCPALSKCKNKRFKKMQYPQSEVFKTDWGGWGLKTLVDVERGQLVHEYVGEIVDQTELERRIEVSHQTQIKNYYFLTLDSKRTIDAGPKANTARFMNHSCDPNCQTQKWTVDGDYRIGLFANEFIPSGTELTFNYQFASVGDQKISCFCNSKNCSGKLGEKVDKDKSQDETVMSIDTTIENSDDYCFGCKKYVFEKSRSIEIKSGKKSKSKKTDYIDGLDMIVCESDGCTRSWCLKCLNFGTVPEEDFICPIHKCNVDKCSKAVKLYKCYNCRNSLCDAHYNKKPDHWKKLNFSVNKKLGVGMLCNLCDKRTQSK